MEKYEQSILSLYLSKVMFNTLQGAVMAVPAHDPRDYEFAKQFNLPIKVVIAENSQVRCRSAS